MILVSFIFNFHIDFTITLWELNKPIDPLFNNLTNNG